MATTAAWWIAQPKLTEYYYSTQQVRGAYRAQADSIAIPIFSAWIAWAILTPLLIALLVWVARRGAVGVGYFARAQAGRVRTIAWSLVALAAAALLVDSAVADAADGYLWLAVAQVPGVVAIAWLRSAVVAASGRRATTGVTAT